MSDDAAAPAPSSPHFKPGQIVKIHSLQSSAGQKLNGNRGVVLRPVIVSGVDRYEIKVVSAWGSSDTEATSAIKSTNLTVQPRRPLPTGPRRGVVADVDDETCRTLCELLLRPTPGFSPSETMLMGYAGMALNRIGHQSNLMALYPYQMEQYGGVLALANTCKEGGVGAAEAALFALLEGHRMYIDVLCLVMSQTNFLGPEEDYEMVEDDFYVNKEADVTPDQTDPCYIKFMSNGPLLLLREMAKYNFGSALFAELQRSEYFHLLILRVLRLIAREGLAAKPADGAKLGTSCRFLLPRLIASCDPKTGEKTSLLPEEAIAMLSGGPVKNDIAVNILENVSSMLRERDLLTKESFGKLILLQ